MDINALIQERKAKLSKQSERESKLERNRTTKLRNSIVRLHPKLEKFLKKKVEQAISEAQKNYTRGEEFSGTSSTFSARINKKLRMVYGINENSHYQAARVAWSIKRSFPDWHIQSEGTGRRFLIRVKYARQIPA